MSTAKNQSNLIGSREQVTKYKSDFAIYQEYAKCLHDIFEEIVKPISAEAIIQSRPKSVLAKEWDRHIERKIPGLLAKAGYGIARCCKLMTEMPIHLPPKFGSCWR